MRQHADREQDQPGPQYADRDWHAELLQTHADQGLSERQRAKDDQAVDAAHAALKFVWSCRQAVARHQDAGDRIDQRQPRHYESQEDGSAGKAIERPEQYKDDKHTVDCYSEAHAALDGHAEESADNVADASQGKDQADDAG